MAVVSTPVSGRLRVTYLNNLPELRINGVSPTTTPMQALTFVNALRDIQSGTMDKAFHVVESDLNEG
jgi:hypothetical protein